jgi:hypothetical protein
MSIRASASRVIVTIESDLFKWLDDESYKRQREKSWMVQEALRRWQHRLETERAKRIKAQRDRVLQAACGVISTKGGNHARVSK